MNVYHVLTGCVAVAIVLISCDSGGGAGKFDGRLDEEGKRFSYALGMEIGGSLKGIGADIDLAAFSAGVQATYVEGEPLLSEQEAGEVKNTVFGRLQQERSIQQAAEGNVNLKAEKEFLEANKANPGVTTTASGLQYKALREGTGARPAATDKVKVHYKGTLLDGTEFDNSHARGEPAVFGVGQLIPGWSEGLQLMKVGGSYQLWIPSSLAYGPRAMGDKIKPNSTLIFEVDLLGIEK